MSVPFLLRYVCQMRNLNIINGLESTTTGFELL